MKLRVHSKIGKPFRRNGVLFGPDPTEIDTDALEWTPEQVLNLMTTPALHVDQAGGRARSPEPGTPEEAVTAAHAAGESLPGESEPPKRGKGR